MFVVGNCLAKELPGQKGTTTARGERLSQRLSCSIFFRQNVWPCCGLDWVCFIKAMVNVTSFEMKSKVIVFTMNFLFVLLLHFCVYNRMEIKRLDRRKFAQILLGKAVGAI